MKKKVFSPCFENMALKKNASFSTLIFRVEESLNIFLYLEIFKSVCLFSNFSLQQKWKKLFSPLFYPLKFYKKLENL